MRDAKPIIFLLSHLARGLPAVLLLAFLAGCRSAPTSTATWQRFEFEQPEMGVPFKLIFYAPDQNTAERAADAAFDRVAQLNAIMSDYETDSEISKLSRTSEEGSTETPLSPDLWNVLSTAQGLARETGGAFDVTIGPCVGLWRKARREKKFPDAGRLAVARAKVGYENLLLNKKKHSARLVRYGMRLDVGGIAKGYAADEALKVLRTFGIDRALAAASGDLALGQPPPGAPGWKIQLSGYDQAGGPDLVFLTLSNCGVSTSGDLSQRVEIDGVRYSHIIDPFTCVGMTNHALATVIAKDDTTADGLATIMTLLDPDQALHIAKAHKAATRIVRLQDETPVVYANRRFSRLQPQRSPAPPPGASKTARSGGAAGETKTALDTRPRSFILPEDYGDTETISRPAPQARSGGKDL